MEKISAMAEFAERHPSRPPRRPSVPVRARRAPDSNPGCTSPPIVDTWAISSWAVSLACQPYRGRTGVESPCLSPNSCSSARLYVPGIPAVSSRCLSRFEIQTSACITDQPTRSSPLRPRPRSPREASSHQIPRFIVIT